MPPFQGFIRFRRHQVGKQSSFASNTTATRRLPFRGALVVDPARTDPDVDVGSLDPVLAPFAGPLGVTGTWEGFAAFDDLPYIYSAGLKGGVTASGATAKTWTYQVASLTADDFDYFTDEWGDDVSSDFIIAGSGVIDSFELGFGDDLSAWNVQASTVYARAQIGTGPTGGLVIDDTPQWVYGADTEFYLDSAFGSIGTTKWTDTVHSATLRVNNNLDLKRFANGSNTRFQLAGYGRGAREIELEVVVAKSAAAIAERATLDDTPVPERFIELRTTSPEIITGSTPYSNSLRVSAYLISAEDGEIGGNSTITLTYRGRYDSDLGYVLRAVVVNTLASL
jgi:hypothetical protein